MKPLLAHIYEPHRVTYPCYVQPKLNGIRALYQNGRFQSRDELPFGVDLLSHLSAPLQNVFGPEVILDGELYVHGWPLQRINAAVTPVRQQPTEDTVKVEYHVFDVVDFNKPFEERGQLGAQIRSQHLIEDFPVNWVNTFLAKSVEIADERYAQFVSDGYEGMMYRLGDCPYTVPKQETYNGWWGGKYSSSRFLSDKNNRVWHLLKRKDWQDDEFTCIGVEEGEGKYKGTLGALVCDVPPRGIMGYLKTWEGPQIRPKFSVGSGITDAERNHYWSNPPLGRLIKVKYLVLSNNGIPLNPTILAIL